MPDLSIATTARTVTDTALTALSDGLNPIIRAHAGAGKTGGRTSGTVRLAAGTAAAGRRVALLIAQNDQVVETVDRLTRAWPGLITNLLPSQHAWQQMPPWIRDSASRRRTGQVRANLRVARPGDTGSPVRAALASQPGLFVMTLEKFMYLAAVRAGQLPTTVTPVENFDVVIVDEAWMAPATVWLNLQHLADQVALIGDPGQIMPWEPDSLFYPGMQGSPIEPLPQLVVRERGGRVVELDLPVSRRNPAHTTALTGQLPAYRGNPTRSMYAAQEVPITPAAILLPSDPVNAALTRMIERGVALYPLTGGLAGTDDPLVARACASAADRLLNLGCRLGHPDGDRALTADDVAIVVAHHDQRMAVVAELQRLRAGRPQPRVATFNTIQGSTVAVTIVWHPLSGREDVNAFHADAGRLTVGLTRHTHGCLVVSRNGVGDRISRASLTDDLEGDAADLRHAGLQAHQHVWEHLAA